MTTRRWKTSSTRSRSTWLNLIPIPGSDRLGRSRNDPVKQSQSTGAIFPVCVGLFRKTGVRSRIRTNNRGEFGNQPLRFGDGRHSQALKIGKESCRVRGGQ